MNKSDKVNLHKVEGFPGAVVWALKEDPTYFYLTNTRNGKRCTFKLGEVTLEHALEEAKDFLT